MRKNNFFRVIFNSKMNDEFIEFLYETRIEKTNKEYEISLKKSFDSVSNSLNNINIKKLELDAKKIQSEINELKTTTSYVTNKKLKINDMTQDILKLNTRIKKEKENPISVFKFEYLLKSEVSNNLRKVFNNEMKNNGFHIIPDTIDIIFNFSEEYSKESGEFLCVTGKDDFITLK